MLLVVCVLVIWMSSSLFIRCKKNNCELWIVNCKFIITFAHSRAYTLNHLCGLSWQGGDNIMERYVSRLGLSWNRNNLLTNKTNCLWSKTTERTLMMRVWWRDSVTALQNKLIKLNLLTEKAFHSFLTYWYGAFSSCSHSFEYRQFSSPRTSCKKVRAYGVDYSCLLVIRSLGGNLNE